MMDVCVFVCFVERVRWFVCVQLVCMLNPLVAEERQKDLEEKIRFVQEELRKAHEQVSAGLSAVMNSADVSERVVEL